MSNINEINIEWNGKQIPMAFPFLSKNLNLRDNLFNNKIYTSFYWSSVLSRVKKKSVEYNLTKNLILLPIDQRYSKTDLDRIINIII